MWVIPNHISLPTGDKLAGESVYTNCFVRIFIIVSPVTLWKVQGISTTFSSKNCLGLRGQCAEASTWEEFTGFEASALESCNCLPLLVLIIILVERILDVVNISGSFTVLTFCDKAGLTSTSLNIPSLDKIEVNYVLRYGLTVGALDLEVPIGLCRLLDCNNIL